MSELQAILNWKKAEADRQAGRLNEALAFFDGHFQARPNTDSAWRRVFCLRRLGRLEEAIALCEEFRKTWPDDRMLKGEEIWLIYDVVVKPAKKDGDRVMQREGALKMIELGADGVAKKMAVFAGIEASRELKAWEDVLAWSDRVTPSELPEQPRLIEGRKIPSWRELWYFAKIKALLELKRFEECRRLALEAQAVFRGRVDFPRWAALALEGTGDLQGATAELDRLARHPRAAWYLLADLARLEVAADEIEKAWLHACRAGASFGDLKSKVNLLTLIARIAEARGEMDVALNHALLAASLREKEGWKIPQALSEVLMRLPLPERPPAMDFLERSCRETWQTATGCAGQAQTAVRASAVAVEPAEANRVVAFAEVKEEVLGEGCRGVVSIRQEGTGFAFIRANDFDQPVFVLLKDLPEECRIDGAPVRFTAVRSYDRKKGREGVRATMAVAA